MTSIPVVVLLIIGILLCRDEDGRMNTNRMFNLAVLILALLLLSPVLEAFFK